MFDIYSGHLFIYRSLYAADPRDPRGKVAVINAACDESWQTWRLFIERDSARRGVRLRRLDGDACTAAQAREWAPVSTREYPSRYPCSMPHTTRRGLDGNALRGSVRLQLLDVATLQPLHACVPSRYAAPRTPWFRRGRVAALQQV